MSYRYFVVQKPALETNRWYKFVNITPSISFGSYTGQLTVGSIWVRFSLQASNIYVFIFLERKHLKHSLKSAVLLPYIFWNISCTFVKFFLIVYARTNFPCRKAGTEQDSLAKKNCLFFVNFQSTRIKHVNEFYFPEQLNFLSLVFVYNKCCREDFEARNVHNMLLATDVIFQTSRLRTKSKSYNNHIIQHDHDDVAYCNHGIFIIIAVPDNKNPQVLKTFISCHAYII